MYLLLACTAALTTQSPADTAPACPVDLPVSTVSTVSTPPVSEPPVWEPDEICWPVDDELTLGPLLPSLGGTLAWDATLVPSLLAGTLCAEEESFPGWRTVACECAGVICLVEFTVPAAKAREAREWLPVLYRGPGLRAREGKRGASRSFRIEETATLDAFATDRAARLRAAEVARSAGCVPTPPAGQAPWFEGVEQREIEDMFQRNADRLERCAAAALDRDPCASGTVGVTFEIEGGRVLGAHLTRTADKELARCILGVVRGLRFPYEAMGGVDYAWYLSPLPNAGGPGLRPESGSLYRRR